MTHTTVGGRAAAWRRRLLIFAAVYLTLFATSQVSQLQAVQAIVHHTVVTLLVGGWLVWRLRRGEGFPRTPLDGPMLALLGAYTLATLFAVDPRYAAEGLWVVGVHVLLFYAAVSLMRAYRPSAVMEPVFFASAVVILIGLIEFLAWYFGLPILPIFRQGWFPIGGLRQPFPPVVYRLLLTLNVPTALSAYLGLLIPVGLGWAVATHRHETRWMLILWLAGALIVEGLSFSRGGLLSLAVSLPVFGGLLLVGEAGRRARLRLALQDWRVLAALGAVLAVGGFVGWSWRSQDFGGHRAGDVQRLDMWRAAWTMGLERPLTGVGPNGFGRALRERRDPLVTNDHMTTPNNTPLLVWSESGLPGALALAWMVGAVAWAAYRRWGGASAPERVRVAGAVAGLFGFGVQNLVDNFAATQIMLTCLALVAYLAAPMERAAGGARLRRLAPAGALALVVVAAAGWGVSDLALVRFTRAIQYAGGGDLSAALDRIDAARRLDPAMGLYAAQRAQYLGQMAAQDGTALPAALAAYEEAFAYEGTSDVMRANFAALLAQSGDLHGALAEMQAAARIMPLVAHYPLWVGRYQEELGEEGAARASYLDALELRPEWAASSFWEWSPVRRAARDEHPAALGLTAGRLSEVAPLHPACWRVATRPEEYADANSARLLACAAWVRLHLDSRPSEALALAERAVTADPAQAMGYLARAEARLALGDGLQAERDARIAIFLGDRQGYLILGRLAEAKDDVAAAERAYRQGGPVIVQQQGYDVAVYGRRGDLRLLPQLDAPGPSRYSFASWLALARLYEAQGRFDDMQGVYQAIRALDPYFEDGQAIIEGDPRG